jgi:transposase
MPGKKGMKHYPVSIKEQAIRMHFEDGLTYKEITNILGITDEQRVNKWCIKYRKEGLSSLQSQSKGRPHKNKRTEQENLNSEIARLKMENQLLRNFLYEVGRS